MKPECRDISVLSHIGPWKGARKKERTAARQVLVPHCVLIDDMEGPGEALRREVDMPRATQGGCGNPEHLLGEDPGDKVVRDRVVELAHVDSSCGRRNALAWRYK